MQQTYIVLISLLAGVLAAGFVWFLWDVAEKIYELLDRWRVRRRLKKDARALMEQAKAPASPQSK